LKSPLSSLIRIKRKEDKKMALYYKGMYLGKIEANEYTIKELQDAGFTVVIK
jgi:hypothetical protein